MASDSLHMHSFELHQSLFKYQSIFDFHPDFAIQ